MGKIGKKELKKLNGTISAAKFFDISEDEVKQAKDKLNPKPKPAKKKVSKKK